MIRSSKSLALVLALPLLLSGCISVFPTAKPVPLYRFGGGAPPMAAGPAAPGFSVLRGAITFPLAAAGDRILTVTGNETAFISGARWVEPASVMFDEALARAFDAPGAPRLVARGEPLPAPITLRLDVRSFEARYEHGRDAPPTVVVGLRATLIRNTDRTVVAEKPFETSLAAESNRVGAITEAFSAAVNQTAAGVRDWTAGAAKP